MMDHPLVKLPAKQVSRAENRTLWMVNHYAVTRDMPGGTRHAELALALEQHGWKTEIFATPFNHNTGQFERPVSPTRLVRNEAVNGTVFRWLYSLPYRSNDWKRYVNMVSFMVVFVVVAICSPRPSIVVGSSAHLLAALGAWIASRWHRVPFVLEIRDIWPDSLIQLGLQNKPIIFVLKRIEHFLYRRAQLIIAVTDGIADRITAKNVSKSKILMIPSGLAASDVATLDHRQSVRRDMKWEEKIVVVWAGSHQPANGLDVVVEAGRLLEAEDNVLLAFIGDGSEKPSLVAQAHELDNVAFYDPVPKSQIGHLLMAADIGLLHSRKFDAFTGARPRKLFEYMGASLPIICTVPGEAWRIVHEADAGVYAAWEDPAALATAIRSLAADPIRRRQLGENGYETIKRTGSLEAAGATLARALKTVVDGKVSYGL